MARGQSPYQGRYTVPIADFSGIERAGAAWGDAFKGIGQQVGGAIKERKVLKGKLKGYQKSVESLEEMLPYLLEGEEVAEPVKNRMKELRQMLNASSDMNLREKVAAYEQYMPTVNTMLSLGMQKTLTDKKYPPSGASRFRSALSQGLPDPSASTVPDLSTLLPTPPQPQVPTPASPDPSTLNQVTLNGFDRTSNPELRPTAEEIAAIEEADFGELSSPLGPLPSPHDGGLSPADVARLASDLNARGMAQSVSGAGIGGVAGIQEFGGSPQYATNDIKIGSNTPAIVPDPRVPDDADAPKDDNLRDIFKENEVENREELDDPMSVSPSSTGDLTPPTPLTPTQERLLAWGTQNPDQVDASIRPQLNAAREQEERIRNYPVELQDYRAKQRSYQQAGIALERARFSLKQDKQPGMSLDEAKKTGNSIKENFGDHKVNLNYSRKDDGSYQLNFSATPTGPDYTVVSAETLDGVIDLPLVTDGSKLFVLNPSATNKKDILVPVEEGNALTGYRGTLEASIKVLGDEELGVDAAGNRYNVRELRDLMKVLESGGETWPEGYITREFGDKEGEPYSTWTFETDIPRDEDADWKGVVFETRKEMDDAFKKVRMFNENEQKLLNLPSEYQIHNPPQAQPPQAPPPRAKGVDKRRALELIKKGS